MQLLFNIKKLFWRLSSLKLPTNIYPAEIEEIYISFRAGHTFKFFPLNTIYIYCWWRLIVTKFTSFLVCIVLLMSIFSEHRDFENTKGHGLPMDQAALRFLIEEARSVRVPERILGQPGWTRGNLRVRGSKG